jgi:hypothetical protein
MGVAQVGFGNYGGKRQGQAFPNMIGRSHQKLACEPRPAPRIVAITLQIGNHQSRVSFINLAHQLLRLLSAQLVRSVGRRRWLPARVSFQALYAFQQRTLHISSLRLMPAGGRANLVPGDLANRLRL